MHKIDHLLNRVVERKLNRLLFKSKHESLAAYRLRLLADAVGPYLLGGVIGLVIVCFIFFGV
jgi:hypothetical protein